MNSHKASGTVFPVKLADGNGELEVYLQAPRFRQSQGYRKKAQGQGVKGGDFFERSDPKGQKNTTCTLTLSQWNGKSKNYPHRRYKRGFLRNGLISTFIAFLITYWVSSILLIADK